MRRIHTDLALKWECHRYITSNSGLDLTEIRELRVTEAANVLTSIDTTAISMQSQTLETPSHHSLPTALHGSCSLELGTSMVIFRLSMRWDMGVTQTCLSYEVAIALIMHVHETPDT